MQKHPTAANLQSFLLGELPLQEVMLVVAHLARGCEPCEAKVEALSEELFGDGTRAAPPSGEPDDAAHSEYDDAIDRAFAAALAATSGERGTRPLRCELLARAKGLALEGPIPPVRETPLCEELIAKSRACRNDDPKRMIHFAKLARFAADNLDPARYGRQTVTDVQARTLAELANAYRVADDLDRAEAYMQQAVETSAQGSGDPLLLARLMDLLASLCCHRRQFDAAIELLDAVYTIYENLGEEHRAGRALISKGLYTGYSKDPRQALVLLTEGLERIDSTREPELALAAVHNILDSLVELGRYGEAEPLLDRFRTLYQRHGGRLDRLRLRWLEGKIAAGGQNLAQAGLCFTEVRLGFEAAGLASPSALVSLDLAAVWLHQGNIAEARDLIEQVIATFKALRVSPEALTALLLLRDAFTHQGTALGMLRAIAECSKRIEPASGMRFELDAG